MPSRLCPPRLIGYALVACVLVGCGAPRDGVEEGAVRFVNLGPDVAFVGDEACATCHEDLYASYQSHGMAQSFYRWTPAVRVEPTLDAPLVHGPTGFAYRVVESDGALYQEETLRTPDGAPVQTTRRRIDYIVGSGNAARTYFTEENGRLFQLPLSWYTQADDGAGRWDFSPGYETTNARFGRLVPDRCMACHNSYPETVAFVEGKYPVIPEGIGCERCHGPGALHVEARLAADGPLDGPDPTIVNPAHLTLDLRLDVCQQCHLHTTVDVLRDGTTAFSYRPGTPLSDHVAFFVRPGPDEGVSVVSHADRMRRSACFTASPPERPLECTTCHDPHEGFRERGPDYFNATCRQCHDTDALQSAMPTDALRAEHAPAANCFSCHMPKVEADDAPHSTFTDHLIRVVRPGERLEGEGREVGRGGILAPYYPRDAGTDDGAVYEGMATVAYGTQSENPAATAHGAALLANTLRAGFAHGEAAFTLGVAAHRLGNLEHAVPALEQAVAAGPDVPQWLEALALAYEAAAHPAADIEPLYRRALAAQPALATVRTSYGHFLQAEGRRAEALETYRAARTERPSYDLAALYEGSVLAELGRRAVAEAALREAVVLEPTHAATLANFLVVTGEEVQSYFDEEDIFGVPVEREVTASAGPPGALFMRVPLGATVRVFSNAGAPVRTLRRGTAPLVWDLRDDAARRVGPGQYLVHVRGGGAARVFRMLLAVAPEAG